MALSVEQISTISDWAQKITIFAGLITAVASLVLYKTTAIEKEYQDQLIKSVNLSAEKANDELNKIKSNRRLSISEIQVITDKSKAHSGQRFMGMISASVPDAYQLWCQIAKALTNAGWILVETNPSSSGDQPHADIALSPMAGVTIVVDEKSMEPLRIPVFALTDAINEASSDLNARAVYYPNVTDDMTIIRVVIGAKY